MGNAVKRGRGRGNKAKKGNSGKKRNFGKKDNPGKWEFHLKGGGGIM